MINILIASTGFFILTTLGALEYIRFLRNELIKTKKLANYRIATYKAEIKDLTTELEKP